MTPSSDGELLPALGDNATALTLGFYHGFVAWIGLRPPTPEQYQHTPENGWYYAGYMAGWVAKLGLLVGLGEVVVPIGVDVAGTALAG